MDTVAAEWAERVRSACAATVADEYYVGRGPSEAKAAVEGVARLIFVSAGLGLVGVSDKVPRYSLTTIAGDPDSVASRIDDDFSPKTWWAELRRARGESTDRLSNICASTGGIVVVALPGTYLHMIEEELVALPAEQLARIRIIGAPRNVVAPPLLPLWMPYDDRFDGEGAPNPGTRGDFAPRAARHFFGTVLRDNPDAPVEKHAEAVENFLSCFEAQPRPSRRAGSDDELIGVISSLLTRTGGRSGQTLALLRREAGRACEQGRFRRLFALALAEGGQS